MLKRETMALFFAITNKARKYQWFHEAASTPWGTPKVAYNAIVTEPAVTLNQLPLGPAQGNVIFKQGAYFAIVPKSGK